MLTTEHNEFGFTLNYLTSIPNIVTHGGKRVLVTILVTIFVAFDLKGLFVAFDLKGYCV